MPTSCDIYPLQNNTLIIKTKSGYFVPFDYPFTLLEWATFFKYSIQEDHVEMLNDGNIVISSVAVEANSSLPDFPLYIMYPC
jgi:hypothetical protein